MKKQKYALRISACIFTILLLFGSLTVSATEPGTKPAAASSTVTIYHTNDMHGALTAIDNNGTDSGNNTIGIARAAALKKNTPNSLLVDAGDATQGLPLASLTQGADIIKLMNLAGYDLMAAGNHEFDYGSEQALTNADNAAFPLLAANVEKDGRPLFEGHNAENNGCHKVITVNGITIGFFGLTTCETKSATNPEGIAGIEFQDEVKTAKREIKELEEADADVIIAVSHLGEYENVPVPARALAGAMTGEYQGRLDAIIDGHSHTEENFTENGVLIAQTGTGLKKLGKMEITPEADGSYALTETLLTWSDTADVTPDPDVADALETITSGQEEQLANRVCETTNTLWGGYINNISVARITETNLGDLVTDAFRDAATDFIAGSQSQDLIPYKDVPVAAVENGGGIRSSIPNGTTTKKELVTAFPFSNTLMLKAVTPQILFQVMEHSLSNVTAQDEETGMLSGVYGGGFLQVSGIQVRYNPNAPEDAKILEMKLDDGTVLSRDDTDTPMILVSNNYIMSGGNDYDMLKDLDLLGEIGGELETIESYINGLTNHGADPLSLPCTFDRIIPQSSYSGNEYTASVRMLLPTGDAAPNKAVSVCIDNKTTKTLYTDKSGILKITVPAGPHGVQIDNSQEQLYINNYTGSGIIEDGQSSYPSAFCDGQTDDTIQITAPSAAETTISSGRSFYVKGTFENIGQIPENSTVSVRLTDTAGDTVRETSTQIKDNKTLKEDLITFKTDETIICDTGMPDLIWDGADEASVRNGDSKCYYNDSGFTALIPGGKTADSIDDKLGLTDKNGNAYKPLSNGGYLLEVSVLSPGGETLGYRSADLSIGSTADKILTRFSGDDHIRKFQAFAAANGYRIYNDAFPGYWSMSDGRFCENAPQWRAADATEYTTGTVHFIIYNVKKSSTTYSVELGLLQSMGDIDRRLVSYYYSTGEPGMIAGIDIQITPFSNGDKLQLVRAELSTEKQKDGIYIEQQAKKPQYDMDISDGITAKAGQNLSLYGVTAPIQADSSDIRLNNDNTYTVNNKIQTLKYKIAGNGKEQTFEKEVILERQNGSQTNSSELEFKHVFPISDDMAGKDYTVSLEGYDAHGRAVAGSKESFRLTVAKGSALNPPASHPADNAGSASSNVKTGDNSRIIVLFWLMGMSFAAGIIVIKRKHKSL